uniref:Transposase n=1 Tax=Klebsiella pneumoniae TaxID=573 RepID=A0A8B0T0F2_KLEPN|nr:Transposase [Klebsiella pneumoniae]
MIKRYRKPRLNTSGPIRTHRKMNATCERFNRTLREQFIEFNELLLFEDLNLFNQRMAEYLVLYNSKRPHKSLELMTPVDYIFT